MGYGGFVGGCIGTWLGLVFISSQSVSVLFFLFGWLYVLFDIVFGGAVLCHSPALGSIWMECGIASYSRGVCKSA